MNNAKIGVRKWLSFILAGLVGQLAWAIENNYLNLYVFDCTGIYDYIPIKEAFRNEMILIRWIEWLL